MQQTRADIPENPTNVPRTRSWVLWVLALLVVVTGVAPAGATANRVIVHVAGLHAGTVEIDVHHSLLPELPYDADWAVIMPTNFCGLRIRRVGAFHWDDGAGNLIAAENHGEVTVQGNSYVLDGIEFTNAYLGGVEFTGSITTCDQEAPWYFPSPLSYGGQGPQFGAARLIMELDMPNNFPTIEFLNHAHEPIELPDLYDDREPPRGGIEEVCKRTPEFCESDIDDLTTPLPGGHPPSGPLPITSPR